MTARSIHIGLNRVDPNAYDGWDGQLNGCINDANSMQSLAGALGYATQTLIDAQATSARVLAELAAAARTLTSGDILLVTYSGHGGQVNDVHGDESDGLDETWVLYDREVIDDELYAMWSQFAQGVRIVVISDSCHSGTVTKARLTSQLGDALARATRDRVPVSKNMPRDIAARVAARDRAMYDTLQYLAGSSARQQIQASVILISGCQDNQLSYDGDVNGAFTGALLAIWQNGAFVGDYRRLHQLISSELPPHQSPNYFTTGASDATFEAQQAFATEAPTGGVTPEPVTARPTLRVGSRGPDVVHLQTRLTAHGYPTAADGDFGPNTQAKVRSFQSAHGLVADGIVGTNTWVALEATPRGKARSGPHTVPRTPSSESNDRPTLRRGDQGEQVSYLQARLRELDYDLPVDGVFNGVTESVVRSFQNQRGLPATGTVDRGTWEALGAPSATQPVPTGATRPENGSGATSFI